MIAYIKLLRIPAHIIKYLQNNSDYLLKYTVPSNSEI